jgi:hypothetical protein
MQEAKTNINRKQKMAYEQMNQMLTMVKITKIYQKKLETLQE